MSDGPYCSPRLPRHWRQVAKRAANSACSDGEILESVEYALTREFYQLPDGLRRPSIFAPLDAIRDGEPLGAFGRIVVEQRQRFANGCPPSLADQTKALARAMDAFTHSHVQGMVEHWLREEPSPRVQRLAERLRGICLTHDHSAFATRLVHDSRPETPARGPRKRAGVDEGPGLP